MVVNEESKNRITHRKHVSVDVVNDAAIMAELLKRDTTPAYSPAAKRLIKNKTVLVTGGGGSIGSEIVRQLVLLGAKKVYCIDNDEYALYKMSLELYGNALLTEDNLVLVDIKDRLLMSRLFARVKPEIVYHAAAHKHLPLLERSPVAGIKTNIFGTDNVASLCVEHGVKYFVNISTDKAAAPVSILGMSKRLAELCAAGYKGGVTKVASVRFGNVLGSRGSFLPTLIWQIENGKPVTVTDPDVSRFFMSIPEAAALVIEASAMSNGGEAYVLDMGEQVRIIDLISRYVEMSGCQIPEIVYTGLREGEKLHEELFAPSEILLPTVNPRITKTNVDQSNAITAHDKVMLRAMVSTNLSPEELKQNLKSLINEIENRMTIPEKSGVPVDVNNEELFEVR